MQLWPVPYEPVDILSRLWEHACRHLRTQRRTSTGAIALFCHQFVVLGV
jgi:hypothetical protein